MKYRIFCVYIQDHNDMFIMPGVLMLTAFLMSENFYRELLYVRGFVKFFMNFCEYLMTKFTF